MIYVKGELKFYDENKNPIHRVKFDLKNENAFKRLLKMVELKD